VPLFLPYRCALLFFFFIRVYLCGISQRSAAHAKLRNGGWRGGAGECLIISVAALLLLPFIALRHTHCRQVCDAPSGLFFFLIAMCFDERAAGLLAVDSFGMQHSHSHLRFLDEARRQKNNSNIRGETPARFSLFFFLPISLWQRVCVAHPFPELLLGTCTHARSEMAFFVSLLPLSFPPSFCQGLSTLPNYIDNNNKKTTNV
jgi:hypothetical protein